jgi:transposase-like protein
LFSVSVTQETVAALKRGYTKNQIATQLGVSNTCIYQWWAGYSLSAKRRTIERLKKFLFVQSCPILTTVPELDVLRP